MTASVSLESLANELQCAIIRYLDPIALIATSQTNTHFRTLIQPRKIQFIERLLALECLEEFGGPEITFSRLGRLSPDRTAPEWESNRWACTACLRLLPYHCFTNKALSQLAYRKPIRGSSAEQQCTSWEPTHLRHARGKGARERRQYPRYHTYDEEEEQILRRRYAIATTQNWGRYRAWDSHSDSAFQLLTARLIHLQDAGLVEFEDMDAHTFSPLTEDAESELFDREARGIELLRAGYNRQHRRCLECRFRRGEFRGCTGVRRGLGTPRVPIIPGRQESFGTVVDRYFPGVCEVLSATRPPFNAPVFVIYRENAMDRPWTLYRARCPGCETWKELRAFRFGGFYPRAEPREVPGGRDWYYNWDMTPVTDGELDGLRCNHCFLKEHGRVVLGDILIRWLTALIDAQLGELTGNLRVGFSTLFWRLKFMPKKGKASTKRLFWDIRNILNKNGLQITRTDVALIRQRRMEWLDLFPKVRDGNREENGLWFEPDESFWQWVELYEESEAMWFWLRELREEICEEGKADVLVDWALSRNEARHS
ncbi:hypothetical protein BJX64DRAFT_260266 [Aspergillus heterothallicus]